MLKKNGKLGFIVPSAWTASVYDIKFRKYLIEHTAVENVVIAPKQTFKDVSVETCIVIFSKAKPVERFKVERWDNENSESYQVDTTIITNNENYNFPVYSNPASIELVNTVRVHKLKLSDFADVVWGVKIYEKGKGTPPQKADDSKNKIFHSTLKVKATHRPLIGGGEIERYYLKWEGGYVDYGKLAAPRNPEWFNGPRLIIREVTSNGIIQATLIKEDYVFSNSVDGVKLITDKIKLEFLLGVLNSKLISFYHTNTSPNAFKGTFPKILLQDLRDLPIPDVAVKANQSLHDEIVKLVNTMLQLQQQKQQTTLPQQLEQLEQRILHTDKTINQKV
ncbi:MAG: N-6 DNA methylase, partial [Sphingobacteriales bacterium]|nr:N-6 DNA methylase [Sphingobacteriales bacterium]